MTEFEVGGVKYRAGPGGVIEVQDLNGQWQTWNGITGARTGNAAAVRQAAQAALNPSAAAAPATVDPNQRAAKISLDEIARLQGQGWTVVGGPVQKMGAGPGGIQIPLEGQYTVLLSGPNGAQRKATIVPQEGFNPTRDDPLDIQWTATDIEEVVKPPSAGQTPEEKNAAVEAAKAQTAYYQAQMAQITSDNAERDRNASGKWGRVTDKEKATLEQQEASGQVSAGQLALARDTMIQNGQNQAGQLAIAQKQLEIAQQNQTLAETRAGIEKRLADNTINKTQADQELAQAQLDWSKKMDAANLELRQLTQSQGNAIAQGQLQVSQQQLAQNAAQAQQATETALQGQRAQAAASVYSAERNAQQEAARTGQGLLTGRATLAQNLINEPFSAAAGLSRGSAGKYGMLSGGGVNIPPGVLGNLVGGAQGLSTAMFGGQSSIDAAVQAIEGIRPGASMSPMGQAAAAFVTQLIDGAKKTAGVGSVPAPSTANTAAPPAAPPAAAPPPAAITAPQTVQSGIPEGTNRQLPFPYPQSNLSEGGGVRRFASPVTSGAPQINLYIGGAA